MMGNQSDPNAVRRMTVVASLHTTLTEMHGLSRRTEIKPAYKGS